MLVFVVLIVLWLLGFTMFHVASGLIHFIAFCVHFPARARRTRAR